MAEPRDFLKEHNDHLERLLKQHTQGLPEIDHTNELRRFAALETLLQDAIQQALIDRGGRGEITLSAGFFDRVKRGLWRIGNWAKRSLVPELAKKINSYIKGVIGGSDAG